MNKPKSFFKKNVKNLKFASSVMKNTKYDGDSEDDLDSLSGDEPQDYETVTLREIDDIGDEIEKIKNKMYKTRDKSILEGYAEYIMQIIMKLDTVDARDSVKIREARKDVILYAQGTLEKLDTLL